MGVQILKTDAGEELVVMSRRDYDALLAQIGDEDAEDRMTLLIAAEARGETPMPEAVSRAILAGDTVLKALRKWRGLTQAELARACGITQSFLSEMEAGGKAGSPDTMARLAKQLNAPPGWLA